MKKLFSFVLLNGISRFVPVSRLFLGPRLEREKKRSWVYFAVDIAIVIALNQFYKYMQKKSTSTSKKPQLQPAL